MNLFVIDIGIAFMLDLLLGDPYWFPHPVRFIGWMIKTFEGILRKPSRRSAADSIKPMHEIERRSGFILMLIVPGITFFAVYLLLRVAGLFGPVPFHALNIYFIYSALAARCLSVESQKVYMALKNEDLPGAREKLSMLVGRDTHMLDKPGVIRGAVETVAENTVDGILSPLFYAFLGCFLGVSAPLTYGFKAVSTLDSMVGYMNEKYIDFGRASAKADDALNFIPARLSGVFIPLAAFFIRMDMVRSFSIMIRDRRKHKSPNCAYPEAAFAGALGIQLGGTNIYFGKAVGKPFIGDSVKSIEPWDIRSAQKLMFVSSFLMLVMGMLLVHAFLKHLPILRILYYVN